MIASQFSLDGKVAIDQDGKNLQPTRPTPGPVFRRAFARILIILIQKELNPKSSNPKIP